MKGAIERLLMEEAEEKSRMSKAEEISKLIETYRDEAERLYKSDIVQNLMKAATQRFRKYNDVSSPDHESAVQYVLDQLEIKKGPIEDQVRAELNDMISGGLS
jgi:hypothetical protein